MRRAITIFISLSLLSCQGQEKKDIKTKEETKVSNKTITTENLVKLSKVNCNQENSILPNYSLNCKKLTFQTQLLMEPIKIHMNLLQFILMILKRLLLEKLIMKT